MFDAIFPKHWTTLQRLMWLKTNALARAVYETITGNPVTFTARNAPLKQLSVAFSPVQSGTGDPSPDNVRPISGWDSLNVEQRGKNLADLTDLEFDDTTYSHSLNIVNYPKLRAFVNDIASLAGQTVFYAVDTTGTSQSGQQKIGAFRFLYGGTNVQAFSPNEAHTITPFDPSTVSSIIIYGNGNGASVKNLMVSLGSSAPSEYTPYNPSSRSISISLGQTVYSGWVDVISGVGEVTHVKAVLDGTGTKGAIVTTVETQTTADGTAYVVLLNRLTAFTVRPKYGGSYNIDCISNMLKQGDKLISNVHLGQFNTSGSYFRLALPDQTLDTKAKVQAWCAENPIELCYELATPIPIQLTPQEVESLAGDNVMWSNANQPITVTYRSN